MLAVVSSSAEACSSVRCERLALPEAISRAPLRIVSALVRTWFTISMSPSPMR